MKQPLYTWGINILDKKYSTKTQNKIFLCRGPYLNYELF